MSSPSSRPRRPGPEVATPLALDWNDPTAYNLLERIFVSPGCTVFRARHKQSGAIVAIKQRSSPELGRFHNLRHELEVLQMFPAHPSIIQVMGAFDLPKGTLHMVLEWADGGDLLSLIKISASSTAASAADGSGFPAIGGPGRVIGGNGGASAPGGGYFPEAALWRIGHQLFSALASLSAAGIIHRDVKGSNCLLFKRKPHNSSIHNHLIDGYDVKLADFGVCALLDRPGDLRATFRGTPYYMAPEAISISTSAAAATASGPPGAGGRSGMARAGVYDSSADVWGAGVVLYEAAALRLPFNGSSLGTLAASIRSGKAPPLPRHYSRELASLIAACLSADPSRRPTAAEAASTCLQLQRVAEEERERAEAEWDERRGYARAKVHDHVDANAEAPAPAIIEHHHPTAASSSSSSASSSSGAASAASGAGIPPLDFSRAGIPTGPLKPPVHRVRPGTAPPSHVTRGTAPALEKQQPPSFPALPPAPVAAAGVSSGVAADAASAAIGATALPVAVVKVKRKREANASETNDMFVRPVPAPAAAITTPTMVSPTRALPAAGGGGAAIVHRRPNTASGLASAGRHLHQHRDFDDEENRGNYDDDDDDDRFYRRATRPPQALAGPIPMPPADPDRVAGMPSPLLKRRPATASASGSGAGSGAGADGAIYHSSSVFPPFNASPPPKGSSHHDDRMRGLGSPQASAPSSSSSSSPTVKIIAGRLRVFGLKQDGEDEKRPASSFSSSPPPANASSGTSAWPHEHHHHHRRHHHRREQPAGSAGGHRSSGINHNVDGDGFDDDDDDASTATTDTDEGEQRQQQRSVPRVGPSSSSASGSSPPLSPPASAAAGAGAGRAPLVIHGSVPAPATVDWMKRLVKVRTQQPQAQTVVAANQQVLQPRPMTAGAAPLSFKAPLSPLQLQSKPGSPVLTSLSAAAGPASPNAAFSPLSSPSQGSAASSASSSRAASKLTPRRKKLLAGAGKGAGKTRSARKEPGAWDVVAAASSGAAPGAPHSEDPELENQRRQALAAVVALRKAEVMAKRSSLRYKNMEKVARATILATAACQQPPAASALDDYLKQLSSATTSNLPPPLSAASLDVKLKLPPVVEAELEELRRAKEAEVECLNEWRQLQATARKRDVISGAQ